MHHASRGATTGGHTHTKSRAMSVAGKRSFAVAVAELRLGCDLVREAHAGPTGTAAERQDPLYIWAVQHDDHSTRQKLEAGWQLGMRQEQEF